MVLKKSYSWFVFALFFGFAFCSTGTAEETNSLVQSIELHSSQEFSFVQQDSSIFTIRPLKNELRSIDNLKNTEAIGVVYLGTIVLGKNATPLSALRDLSVQISSGLDIDLALITDSTTSKSLEPHELLLLYHPHIVITLALTKVAVSSSVDEKEETEQETTEEESDNVAVNDQYSLIGTYAISTNPPPAPAIEQVTEPTQETVE